MNLQPFQTLPSPPSWLRDEARSEWYLIGDELIDNQLLNPLTVHGFALLCATSGQIIETLKRGELVDPVLFQTFRALRSDFWLTPSRSEATEVA